MLKARKNPQDEIILKANADIAKFAQNIMHWENRLCIMMATPMPFDAKRNARLHALLLRVNRVKAAASMAMFLSQN